MTICVLYKNKLWTGGITYKPTGNELTLTNNPNYAVIFDNPESALNTIKYWLPRITIIESELQFLWEGTEDEKEQIRKAQMNIVDTTEPEQPAREKRSINSICIDADKHKHSLNKLQQFKEELIYFRQDYSKVDFSFAIEHINNYLMQIKNNQKAFKYKYDDND